MSEYSPDLVLQKFHDVAQRWAKKNGGLTSVATDAFHVLEILAESPLGLRVIVHWAGDVAVDEEQCDIAFVTHTIEIILSFNLGLTAKPESGVMANREDRKSLLKNLSILKGNIRGMKLPDEETSGTPRYVGCEPVVTPEGVPLAAYRMSFKLDTREEELIVEREV